MTPKTLNEDEAAKKDVTVLQRLQFSADLISLGQSQFNVVGRYISKPYMLLFYIGVH